MYQLVVYSKRTWTIQKGKWI